MEPFVDSNFRPLTEDEVKTVISENPTQMKAIRVLRSGVDNPIQNQEISLVTIDLFDEPKPSRDGHMIYGMAKVRGAFPNAKEAEKHANKLLATKDSIHSINYVETGKWFPISKSPSMIVEKDVVSESMVSDSNTKNREIEKKLFSNMSSETEKVTKEAIKKLKEKEDNLINQEVKHDKTGIQYYALKRHTEMSTSERIRQLEADLKLSKKKHKLLSKLIHKLDSINLDYKEDWLEYYNHDPTRGRVPTGYSEFVPSENQYKLLYSYEFDDIEDCNLEDLAREVEI